MPLTEPTGDFNQDWVQEFYVMLMIVDWTCDDPTLPIRGVDVSIPAESINTVLRVPNESHDIFPARELESAGAWLAGILVPEDKIA